MKVFVRETMKTVGVNIYGTDGKLHTEDFFEKYFSDTDGIYPTLQEEKEEFGTQAVRTIVTDADFNRLASNISDIQNAIDGVGKRLDKGDDVRDYTFDDNCFLI